MTSPVTGVGTLVGFMLRRDKVRLPSWVAGFALFMLYLAAAIPAAYGVEEDLAGAASMFSDPVGRLIVGPGHGFDAPSLERFVTNGYGLYFMLLVALMSILTVVRHTRLEEQAGRAELVRASVVGPHAGLAAAMLVTLLYEVAVSLAMVPVMLVVGGFGLGGSLLFAASVGAVGLAFGGLTAVTAQLSEYSRGAAGMAGIGLGIAFVLRAGGDMVRQGGSLLSWFSPLGWGQQTAPFVLDRWWPLLLLLAFAALTTWVGFVLSIRRDVGASLYAVRAGRPRARPRLGTPLGLAARLQRASVIGWTASLFVSGILFGTFADLMRGAEEDLPEAFREIFGEGAFLDAYLAYMVGFMAYLVAAFAVLAMQGLRAEETRGRAEPLLATPMSRTAWLGSNLLVAAGGVLAAMVATGLGTALGVGIVTGDWSRFGQLTAAHANFVPPVWVVLGVATLLFGLAPRLVPAASALVGYALVVGTFGPLLDLPQALFGVSPFDHPSQMPLEVFAAVPFLVLTGLAVLLALAGVLAFRRREIDGV